MNLETNAKERNEKDLELALETFVQMVSQRQKREALDYYWAQEEQVREFIRKDSEGNMYLKEACLYGI